MSKTGQLTSEMSGAILPTSILDLYSQHFTFSLIYKWAK